MFPRIFWWKIEKYIVLLIHEKFMVLDIFHKHSWLFLSVTSFLLLFVCFTIKVLDVFLTKFEHYLLNNRSYINKWLFKTGRQNFHFKTHFSKKKICELLLLSPEAKLLLRGNDLLCSFKRLTQLVQVDTPRNVEQRLIQTAKYK